jgi:hypothetical protein
MCVCVCVCAGGGGVGVKSLQEKTEFCNLNSSILQIVPGIYSGAKQLNGPWCNKVQMVCAWE